MVDAYQALSLVEATIIAFIAMNMVMGGVYLVNRGVAKMRAMSSS